MKWKKYNLIIVLLLFIHFFLIHAIFPNDKHRANDNVYISGTITNLMHVGLDSLIIYPSSMPENRCVTTNGGQFDIDIGELVVSIESKQNFLPGEYRLSKSAWPNPATNQSNILLSIPTSEDLTVEIYNILGQKINTITKGNLPIGSYRVTWGLTDNAGNIVSTGLYFYRIRTDARELGIVKTLVFEPSSVNCANAIVATQTRSSYNSVALSKSLVGADIELTIVEGTQNKEARIDSAHYTIHNVSGDTSGIVISLDEIFHFGNHPSGGDTVVLSADSTKQHTFYIIDDEDINLKNVQISGINLDIVDDTILQSGVIHVTIKPIVGYTGPASLKVQYTDKTNHTKSQQIYYKIIEHNSPPVISIFQPDSGIYVGDSVRVWTSIADTDSTDSPYLTEINWQLDGPGTQTFKGIKLNGHQSSIDTVISTEGFGDGPGRVIICGTDGNVDVEEYSRIVHDETSPYVVSTNVGSPVGMDDTLKVWLNQQNASGTPEYIQEDSLRVTLMRADTNEAVDVAWEFSPDDNSLTILHDKLLYPDSFYRLTITGVDSAGNEIDTSGLIDFQTKTYLSDHLLVQLKEDGSTRVPLTEFIAQPGVAGIVLSAGGETPDSLDAAIEGDSVKVTGKNNYWGNTHTYRITATDQADGRTLQTKIYEAEVLSMPDLNFNVIWLTDTTKVAGNDSVAIVDPYTYELRAYGYTDTSGNVNIQVDEGMYRAVFDNPGFFKRITEKFTVHKDSVVQLSVVDSLGQGTAGYDAMRLVNTAFRYKDSLDPNEVTHHIGRWITPPTEIIISLNDSLCLGIQNDYQGLYETVKTIVDELNIATRSPWYPDGLYANVPINIRWAPSISENMPFLEGAHLMQFATGLGGGALSATRYVYGTGEVTASRTKITAGTGPGVTPIFEKIIRHELYYALGVRCGYANNLGVTAFSNNVAEYPDHMTERDRLAIHIAHNRLGGTPAQPHVRWYANDRFKD